MKAIYKGKLYTIVDDDGGAVKLRSLDIDMDIWVSYGFGPPDLIIDPTDTQIKEETNDTV